MALSSQFALSLELMHLIPRAIADRVNAGVDAIIRSGSDPETERLTMEVFGRNRIERLLECTFIEVMEISTKTNIFRCDARSRRRAHPEASSQTSRVSSNRYSNFNAFLITITATASAKYYSDESKIG